MADPLPAEPRRAPVPFLGRLLEPFYRAAIARRNTAFNAWRGVQRFTDPGARPIPVISIGNLSMGGTGKTPMVMHVLRVLLEHGHRPCVAMRGYSKSTNGAPDEADAYRRAFPDVPIVAQPDRTAGVRAMLSHCTPETRPDRIVLDDGFQHRQIGRDLDVVLIDATPGRSAFADRLLPAGWLREPVASLARAGAIVLTHAELATGAHLRSLSDAVRGLSAAPIAVTRHVWTGLKRRIDAEDRMLPLETLLGKRVLGCCAIGHPAAFTASLRAVAGKSIETIILPDHDPFQPTTVDRLRNAAQAMNAEFIVVTDKDWSKLRNLPDSTWPCPVVRPELAIVFDSGRQEFDRLVLGVGNRARRT